MTDELRVQAEWVLLAEAERREILQHRLLAVERDLFHRHINIAECRVAFPDPAVREKAIAENRNAADELERRQRLLIEMIEALPETEGDHTHA